MSDKLNMKKQKPPYGFYKKTYTRGSIKGKGKIKRSVYFNKNAIFIFDEFASYISPDLQEVFNVIRRPRKVMKASQSIQDMCGK